MRHYSTSLCWFRRDLRLYDHVALYHALKHSSTVYCVFVFDTDILHKLSDKKDRRVEFIWHSVHELSLALRKNGSALYILHGSACQLIPQFALQINAQAVFINRDYEPDAIKRDENIAQQLAQHHIPINDYKDQVIFDRNEVLTGTNKPFSIFTPYKNAWLKKLKNSDLHAYPVEKYFSTLANQDSLNTFNPKEFTFPKIDLKKAQKIISLSLLGFKKTDLTDLALPLGMSGAQELFENFKYHMAYYHEWRNLPSMKGMSYLSAHLRFGTISIRSLISYAYHATGQGAQTWLSELIWRDFYKMLLYHHPYVMDHAFKTQFENLAFTNNMERFLSWKSGLTGYPLVDAGMRQLNNTGFMHNRLRMVTASFLVKDLQIDWRWGEKYFSEKLIDFDLSSNNGGWQWVASTGCDAQPWFRIFNPVTQSEKVDPNGDFIRLYLPELIKCPNQFIHAPWKLSISQQNSCDLIIGKDYPGPIVDHAIAREKTLLLYKNTKSP